MRLTNELREFWDCGTFEEARDTRISVPAQPQNWNDGFQSQEIRQYIEGMSGNVWLDYGCGAGRITRQLLRMGKEVHAIDVSGPMLQYCKEQCVGFPNLFLYLSDGYGCNGVADHSVDCIISYYVFQHMPEWEMIESCLVDFTRVAKPGAYVKIQSRTNETTVNGVSFSGVRQVPDDYIRRVPWKHIQTENMALSCWSVLWQVAQ